MQEDLKKILEKKPSIDDALKLQIKIKNFSTLPKTGKQIIGPPSNDFASMISKVVEPHHSAKEMIENIIKAALEVEYGNTFSVSKGFGGMISKIADTMISNSELRREALSIASEKIEIKRLGKQNVGQKKN